MKRPQRRLLRSREVLLLSIPLALNAVLYAYLTGARRMVNAHDTFANYIAQFVFLSNAAQTGEAPLWIPNMAHGVASNLVLAFQGGGLLHNILLPFAPLLKGANFLPLFHWGMFLEEMVLFLGTWLLSTRYFRSPYSRFFVSTAVLGSSFWADQINFNFRMLNALPLVLWLIEGYFEDSKVPATDGAAPRPESRPRREAKGGGVWKLLCAGAVLVLQAIGAPSYVAFSMAVVAGMYGLLRILLHRREAIAPIKATRVHLLDGVWLVLLLLCLGAVCITLFHGKDQFTIYSPGRTPEGQIAPDDFLSYGGPFHPLRFLQFLLGFSPPTDYSLFCGYLTAVFALLSPLFAPTRRVLHLSLCALIIALFSFAHMGIVASAAYTLVPGMSYFRHLWLVSPFVKFFAILLSGFTVDALLLRSASYKWPLRLAGGVVAVVPAAFAFFLIWITKAEASGAASGGLSAAVSLRKLFVPDGFDPQALSRLAEASVLTALLAAGVVFLCSTGRRHQPIALALLLVVQPLDTFGWKFMNFFEKTFPLNSTQYAMQEIRPVRYVPRRSIDYEANERFAAWPKQTLSYGSTYFSLDSYFEMDPPASRYRINYWMQPFDDLLRVFWGQPLRRPEIWPRGLSNERLVLPPSPILRKLIGSEVDKIGFFSTAHRYESLEAAARALSNPNFRGDILIVTAGGSSRSLPAPVNSPAADLSSNERLTLPYEVVQFSSNQISLNVNVPPSLQTAWLFYADVWHPEWRAKVNGRPVPVERGFIAYKAIPLEPAGNTVEFSFVSPWRVRGISAIGVVSALWIGLVLGWAAKTLHTLAKSS